MVVGLSAECAAGDHEALVLTVPTVTKDTLNILNPLPTWKKEKQSLALKVIQNLFFAELSMRMVFYCLKQHTVIDSLGREKLCRKLGSPEKRMHVLKAALSCQSNVRNSSEGLSRHLGARAVMGNARV